MTDVDRPAAAQQPGGRTIPDQQMQTFGATPGVLKPPVIRPPFPPPFPPPAPGPAPVVTTMSTPVLGGAVGCDFRSGTQQLFFVEFGGNVSRLDLLPATTVLTSGALVLPGTGTLDLDTGTIASGAGDDVFWEQLTSVQRQLVPVNGAQLINLGVVDFASLSPAGLLTLPYGTAPIPGNADMSNRLVVGDVFAVRTNAGNYAKVQVTGYGYDLALEWVTYQPASQYVLLGTGYAEPEDIRLSSDGVHAYVTERAGNLLRVDLGSADRAAATVLATGMTAPQQLVLDEHANVAYTVEYAAGGTLWRIDLGTGATTAVLTGLDHAVGLALSPDGQYAYVSEQTSGPDAGRVSRYELSSGTRIGIATGLVAPFFLTWADAAQTQLLCPQRDPSDSLALIDCAARTSTVAVTGLAFRPSCTAMVRPGTLLVTCDQVIQEVALTLPGQQPDGPYLESIGFVPFDWITPGGLADTTSHDPSYFFQVHDAPFGGSLPVMVNFVRAGLEGAAYYQVTVDGPGNVRTDQFHTAKWDGTEYAPVVIGTVAVNGQPGFYEIPTIADLASYIQPLPGCYLDSTTLPSGTTHTIEVAFYNAAGTLLASADPVTIFVDNRPCAVTLSQARIGATVATTACGFLPYAPATKLTDHLHVDYSATQPGGFAVWSFELIKASAAISAASGPVPAPATGFDDTVADVLAGCIVAAFSATVYAAATATTGWGRCSQYDRSATEAFALAPGS